MLSVPFKYIYLLGVTIQNMLGILDIYWVVGPLSAPNMKGIHVECFARRALMLLQYIIIVFINMSCVDV